MYNLILGPIMVCSKYDTCRLESWHRVLEYYQDFSNDDLRLTLTFSTAGSNMGKC